MNFKTLLSQIVSNSLLNEAPDQSGQAEKKERAKSASPDAKARDAARKRVERAQETPREKKPKEELIKDVILVKTRSGAVQLIFKDSFNASLHQKLNKDALTMQEAQKVTKEEGFEQTRASKLLFGDVKVKPGEKEERGSKKEEQEKQEKARPKDEEEKKKEQKAEGGRAKKMSQEEMFRAMAEMNPEQLMGMPPELRNEYFKMNRQPPANNDFDRVSYEGLSVEYGLSNISGVPFNQQVLNALVFLGKLKAGASDQEMQTYLALAPDGREFTRSAFFTAKKILSQIGDECLQNLLSNVETGGKPVNSEGSPDMVCGDYRFKVAAGGEISFSTTAFDQSNKSFKGFIARALTQALSNPQLISGDQKLSGAFSKMKQGKDNFSTVLVSDDMVAQIKSNPELLAKLQRTPITSASGENLGTVIDKDGNLNQMASLSYYTKAWEEGAREIFKGGSGKNVLKQEVIQNVLKGMLRGDNITDPKMAPNHLITVNGIFPMTDEYFKTIAGESNLDVSAAKDVINSSNISNYKPSAAAALKKFTTIVEAKKQSEVEKISEKDVLIPIDSIDPINLMVNHIVNSNDFLLNASLLPGFNTKDLNSVQYNYVTIGKKTIKIPVLKGENVSNEVLGEATLFINDLLVEGLTNNFVITAMRRNLLLSEPEYSMLTEADKLLVENSEYLMINVAAIYENAIKRMQEEPNTLVGLVNDILIEATKRNYKKEYRNYHGKPKQRKERAARTKAREQMIKKGRVKKGDGKDIDHKVPLRNGGSKGLNNLRVRDRSENRSDNGHKKGEKQNKDWK